MLDKTREALLAALRCTLWGDEIHCIADWDAVMKEAYAQAVAGLVAVSIPASDKTREVQLQTISSYTRYIYEQNKLIDLFYDIPLVILKGTAAACGRSLTG